MAAWKLDDGRARFVRHGHGPERDIQTGIGAVPVQRAKVRDRGAGEGEARIRFTSPSLEALIPVPYLRGVSTGDFQEALSALLGPDAPNLSPAVLGRLKVALEAGIRALATTRSFREASSNPIESTFATVRHRAVRAIGCLRHETSKIMVFKLIQAAQASWRKLDGQNQLPTIIDGIEANGATTTDDSLRKDRNMLI